MEWQIIDTATFQRLRHLRQLGLGQHVYPNATHTRFAHSLGVLAIMHRVVEVAKRNELGLTRDDEQDIRLAGLLHDIGHYPYSHLMEHVDRVFLTEERLVRGGRPRKITPNPYPKHTKVGEIIITSQRDILDAIGGRERAKRIAGLFTGEAKHKKLVKLITSSLDMDRLDYLIRDARSAGVPFGEIDINYLLENLRTSKSGELGIDCKAASAAEQALFARYFMHRAVYYHKTTYGLEEALRQLIRRCRDTGKYGIPQDGEAIMAIARNRAELLEFTDAFLDSVAQKALDDESRVIRSLAETVVFRRPPKLLREVVVLLNDAESAHQQTNEFSTFWRTCVDKLPRLARRFKVDRRLFLITQLPKPLRLETRGPVIAASGPAGSPDEKEDELIQVFLQGESEPKSLVEVPNSLLYRCGGLSCQIARLYVIENDKNRTERMKHAVRSW